MTMMLSSTVASKTIGALASRATSRHSSNLLRCAAASTLASANATSLSSKNTPSRHQVASLSPPISAINNNATAPTLTSRSFSSMGMPRRGYPQYTVFGPDSALSVRAILPQFKRAGSDGVSVDRRGKLVLEFVPRANTGAGFAWQDKTMFSMSVEEVGLILSQLPENPVELSHATYKENDDGSVVKQLAGDAVQKVLTVEAGEGATLKFKVDFMMGGVGGQTPHGAEGLPSTPVEITIQAGEFEVFKSICQTSIPYLLGWNTTMDIASAAAMSRGVSGGDQRSY